MGLPQTAGRCGALPVQEQGQPLGEETTCSACGLINRSGQTRPTTENPHTAYVGAVV